MNDTPPSTPPWYHNGLRFQCGGCGRCCVGEPGYVWVNRSEIAAMAAALAIDPVEFEGLFVRTVGRRRSLKERPNGDCVLFDNKTKTCKVYEVRTRQCRSWPFWHSNLRTPATWEQTCRECPGAGRGPIVPLDEIETCRTLLKM